MYICVYTYLNTNMCKHLRTRACTSSRCACRECVTSVYTCVYTHIMHTCVYTHIMHTCVYTHYICNVAGSALYMCVYTCMYACRECITHIMHTCVYTHYICVYTHVCMLAGSALHLYIHVHTHIMHTCVVCIT